MLIASRALLGVAGAAVTPSVLALVTGMFTDQKQRSRALAIYLTCFMGGATLGPLVGGVLLEYFWWGSVFLVAVPGIVLLLVFGPSLLPDQKAPQAGKLDQVSVVLSLAAILPFVYGLKELARHGWEPLPAVALVFGIAAGAVFVQRQRHLTHPLLDLCLFGNRTFSSALILFFVTALVGAGTLLLVSLYLQNVTGLTPLAAGLLLLVPNVLMIVGNLSTPPLANHIRPAYLIAGGLIVAGVGYTTFTLVDPTSGPMTIFIAMCVVMLGTAPLAALCNHLAMGAVPPDKAGSGASIVQTTTELGLGLGIATLATLGTAVCRSKLEGALGTVPPDAADAARESIDRAVAGAGQLPAEQSGDLLAAARDAFTSGVHVVGIVSAIFYAGLAVLAIRAFKHVRNSHGGDDDTTNKDKETDPVPEAAPMRWSGPSSIRRPARLPQRSERAIHHLPRETVWKVAGWVRSRVSLWREASKRASYIRFAGSWEREMEPLWSLQTVSRTGILGSLRSGFRRRFYLHAILRGGSQEPIDVLLFDERRGRKVGSRLAYFLEVLLQPRRY